MAEQLYRKRISPASGTNVDDLVSKNVLAQLRRDPPPRLPAHNEHGKPPTSGGNGAMGGGLGGGVEASDLISSMAKRLAALEREMKERQNLLQQVQADNASLKIKLKAAEEEVAKRALAALEQRNDSPAVMHLRSENARLRAQLRYAWKQVAEMKAFLNDYGMIWMGEPEVEAELVAHGFGPADSSARSTADGSDAAAPLQPLPAAEAPDQLTPRPLSQPGAAAGAGPSSEAAAAAAAVERRRSLDKGAAEMAAAAALGRAGESPMARREGATPSEKRSSSFTTASPPPASSSAPLSPPPAPASQPSSSPGPSRGPSRPGLPFSMAELLAKVDELNDLAGDGCGQVVRGAAGQHVLATQEPVNLVIYRDGLQIHTLPAKPFNDPASSAVLHDILDGYFPYVLKRDFPDGVPLRVVDRTSDSMGFSPMKRGAAGAGAGNIRTFDDIDSHAAGSAEPLSRDKFLSRLPQAVIKNGKVIEIRSDISRMLGGGAGGSSADGGKADVALISTPVDALLSTVQRNHVGPMLPPPSREGQPPATEVTTLQVKSVDGKQTYILKFKYDDNIGSLRACINAHHAKAGHSNVTYEIRSAFPARAYADDSETLRQAGLVPNATLFLRAV